MSRRAAALLPALVAALVLLAGCWTDPAARPSVPRPEPAVGGPTPHRHAPPRRAMDEVERTVAQRLARQVAAQGMTLAHVDCPRWTGTVPDRMTCRGYLDGLVTTVRVLLTATPRRTVGFDARLDGGVVATRNLERTLHEHGWPAVDCGEVPAYPADVGAGIVCLVRRGAEEKYVVATVRSRAGAVQIDDYARSGGGE